KGIRQHDADGEITLVGEEPHAPYARPPLSKGLWKGKDEASIDRGTAEHGVDLKLGRKIVSLDLDAKQATDDAGQSYDYDRLLLATGGTPRQFPGAPDGVIYLDRKSTRLNSSHSQISYAVFCLKKKKSLNPSDTLLLNVGDVS